MSIRIDLGCWSSIFAVPSKIVDEGLKFSDGVKLKVLLYVLRNSDKELDFDAVSKATGVNVTDIPEALDYWVSMGVFNKSNEVYTPVKEKENSVEEIKTEQNSKKEITVDEIAVEVDSAKKRFTITKPQKPDYVFTAQRLAVDEELKILVGEVQSVLGKILSNSDISTLLMLKDTCGLPLDVILMLIQYCVSIDKGNMRTIEKMGIKWADDGIYSVESADNKIRQIKQTSKNFSIISSVFGLVNVGSPTKKQLEYGDKWIGEWKFSPEMLREAYERCVDTKGEMKFNYIDGILKKWNSLNIKSREALIEVESGAKSKETSKKASYDIDELEKIETLDDF